MVVAEAVDTVVEQLVLENVAEHFLEMVVEDFVLETKGTDTATFFISKAIQSTLDQ